MDDIKKMQKDSSETPKKKNKTLTIKVNRTSAIILGVVVLVVAALFIGKAWGADRQKKADAKSNPFSSRTANTPISNRWTSVGTITTVSDSSITVKDSRGQEKVAAITKDTKIVNRKNEDLKPSDLKKDQRIIISGTKDEKDKNKLSATRIRLQQ